MLDKMGKKSKMRRGKFIVTRSIASGVRSQFRQAALGQFSAAGYGEAEFVSSSVAGASFTPGWRGRTPSRLYPGPQPSVDAFVHGCSLFQDVHSRYRTEAHQDVVGRFNERWVCSPLPSPLTVGSHGGSSAFLSDPTERCASVCLREGGTGAPDHCF